MENELVLYILMRSDLPSMNPGKAMAQASHASNAMTFNADCLDDDDPRRSMVVDWLNQTDQGFGTVLVLECNKDDLWEIQSKINDFKEEEFLYDDVIDPTYPHIVDKEVAALIHPELHKGGSPIDLPDGRVLCLREEVTCAYLLADKNSNVSQYLVGKLKLHP